MKNRNPFKGAAIFLTVVLAVLGIYTFNKYLDYRNEWQYFYSDTERNEALQNPIADKNSSQAQLNPADTGENTDSSPLWDYEKKWGYGCLSKEEKELYIRICNAAKEEKTAVNARGTYVKQESFNKILYAVRNDNPQFLGFYEKAESLYNTMSSYMSLVKINYYESSDYKSFETAADTILSQAKKQPTDYLKVRYVHDALINNCSYNQSAGKETYNFSAAGPIMYKTGVCEGYSKAFCYLVQSMGIPCLCVPGTATNNSGQTDGHMWNMVKLGENWYNIDVTWDDPVSLNGGNILSYDYFLKGNSFYYNHTPDAEIELPASVDNYKILNEVL